jgi:hypothetical protein
VSIIRFPTNARFSGEQMASRPGWLKKLYWKVFGHRRKANVAKLRLDRARRYG